MSETLKNTPQNWYRFFGLLAVFTLALAVRIGLLVIDGPALTPDSRLSMRIADNVVSNWCYSSSPPAEKKCVPTWANQPPGYPIFIALVKLLLGDDSGSVITAQVFLYALALVYALSVASRFFRTAIGLVTVGFIMALSPLSLPSSRWVLTETLAAAGALWVFAECLRSLVEGKFRAPSISLALLATTLIRWDMIWLFALVVFVACHLLNTRAAVAKLLTVLSFVSIPFLVLVMRAWAVGLPLLPSTLTATDEAVPPGIVYFWRVASVNQTATKTLLWNVWNRQYERIGSEPKGISGKVDPIEIRLALTALSSVPNGQAVPKTVDKCFALLAERLVTKHASYSRFVIPLERTFGLWTGRESGPPWRFGSYHSSFLFYKWTLLLVLITASLWPDKENPAQRAVARGVFAFISLRTIFLVSLTALETRYLVPFYPVMELTALIFLTAVTRGSPDRIPRGGCAS